MPDMFTTEVDTMTVPKKLRRLLAKFPEEWIHDREKRVEGTVVKVLHHVTYKSSEPGRQVIRLIDNVSSDMCELVVTLKKTAEEALNAEPKASKSAPLRKRSAKGKSKS